MASPEKNISHPLILQQVKELLLNIIGSSPVVVYLFGSWARQEEKASSDIDIGIWYDKPLPIGTFTHIRTSFEESTIPFRIDVVDLTKADPILVAKVRNEGIVWKDYWNE